MPAALTQHPQTWHGKPEFPAVPAVQLAPPVCYSVASFEDLTVGQFPVSWSCAWLVLPGQCLQRQGRTWG